MTLSGWLAVLLTAAGAESAGPGSLDSATVVTRARALHPAIGAGDVAALWAVFDEGMRAAMQDSASFAVVFSRIHAQTGAIDSVLHEEVLRNGEHFVYRARCRFATTPDPALLTIDFGPDGRVAGLSIRPVARKAFASPFLDYRTRTPLRLPFRGEWFVFWGGRTLQENYHAATRSQRFAHDLVIRKDGSSHRGDGKRCEDYWCYGEPILAPAAGVVVWREDGQPDQTPGGSDTVHPIGNGVILDHGNSEFSLLAHLQPGSLKVAQGAKVREGDVIGRCGNSGNTSEPHLHYHLQNGPAPNDADGLPAFFVDLVVDGRDTTRAEIVRGQAVRRKGAR